MHVLQPHADSFVADRTAQLDLELFDKQMNDRWHKHAKERERGIEEYNRTKRKLYFQDLPRSF